MHRRGQRRPLSRACRILLTFLRVHRILPRIILHLRIPPLIPHRILLRILLRIRLRITDQLFRPFMLLQRRVRRRMLQQRQFRRSMLRQRRFRRRILLLTQFPFLIHHHLQVTIFVRIPHQQIHVSQSRQVC